MFVGLKVYMTTIHFITFANTSYMRTDRILQQAQDLNIFNTIQSFNEYDIPEFIKKHSNFIKTHKDGYGKFIWKSKIIHDKLLKIKDNDILLYCDAGVHINNKGRKRFLEYLDMLKENEIITFLTSPLFQANLFVKNDAVMYYYPEFNDEMQRYLYAGVMLIKKTEKTLSLLSDWLHLCEIYNFLDNSKSVKYPDIPCFDGQDGDNGLFALCVYKYKDIVTFIDPHEFNIYDEEGRQVSNIKDWSKLDNYPLQCRRDRPPR
jgi:hypothetical protein